MENIFGIVLMVGYFQDLGFFGKVILGSDT